MRSLSTNDCEARWAFDAERNPYRRVNADENGFTAVGSKASPVRKRRWCAVNDSHRV